MYYFHLKTNILAHFQISSSVSLRNKNILENRSTVGRIERLYELWLVNTFQLKLNRSLQTWKPLSQVWKTVRKAIETKKTLFSSRMNFELKTKYLNLSWKSKMLYQTNLQNKNKEITNNMQNHLAN